MSYQENQVNPLIKVHFDEASQSQLPFIELLINMGYKYISSEEALRQRGGDNSNFILHDIAAAKLMELNGYDIDGVEYKFSEKDVRDAIDELEHIPYEGLIDTAQKIYNTVMPTSGGKTITVNQGGKKMSRNFRFIDFKNPGNNSFHVTAEFNAGGKQNIRPDIVCFVNGIPLAIIENKKSSRPAADAVNQMNRNQGPEYCPKLFTYAQLLIATNNKELKYGTTGTQLKFYSLWREKDVPKTEVYARVSELIKKPIDTAVYARVLADLNGAARGHSQKTDRLPTEQDRGVVSLLEPVRFLDLAKNFILFDAGEKKLARYQQYFAIHKMLQRIREKETTAAGIVRRRGGLVWHTQGSGKSLTMVMFVKALIESPDINNPRVIIVTDRRDLDRQIKTTFINCNLKKEVVQARSGQHLIDLVREKNLSVITTLVHKFAAARKKNAGFVDNDNNIFVLVDEAHRTQGGLANLEMNRVIPNACYIGFTGTPLMTSEKESWRKFGGYIDKYTIDDALADKIILPLIYEGRYVDLEQNAAQMDRHIDRIAEPLAQYDKVTLQKQIKKKLLKDNPARIEEIAYDIEEHYMAHFQGSGLKGQIVAPSKYAAILFQQYLAGDGEIKTAVVISDEHEAGDEEDTHKAEVLDYLATVRHHHGNILKYEKDVIESFKYSEDGIELIIVVDKLLTGFDAPRNTILYLAKDLHDHNLLQAIARVNRLYENDRLPKTAGYIIDYSENAKNIDTAMQLFGNYDDDDVKSALIDVAQKTQELERSYSALNDIFKTLKAADDDEQYLRYLSDKQKREFFYKSLNDFIKKMNECYALQDFVHQFNHLDVYKRELKKFVELRKTANLRYADRTDLSAYKYALIKILDKYVDANGVELLTKQVKITDRARFDEAVAALGSDKSKAEAIAAQTSKTIKENMDKDPEYYRRFSQKIKEILDKMREEKLADIEALEQMKLIRDNVVGKKDATLPAAIKARAGADTFYRNLQPNFKKYNLSDDAFIDIVMDIFSLIKQKAIVDWYKNSDVKRRIANGIDDYLYDVVKGQKGVDISSEDMKKIVADVMSLAEKNPDDFAK